MAVRVRAGGGRRPGVDLDNDSPQYAAVETPTQRIIAAANTIRYVTSHDGVKLGVRKLGALDEMRVTRAVGTDSVNQQFFLWCMMAASIQSIDGDVLPIPQSILEFEAVIQRIGDDGVAALQGYTVDLAAEAAADKMRGRKAKG